MKERESSPPEREYLPRHVGIIMDGNGRWAKARGLPREMGHRAGSKVVGEIIRHCKKTGIPTITIYALSTENWKRPQKEVDALLELLRRYLSNMEEYQKENARLIVLGDAGPAGEHSHRPGGKRREYRHHGEYRSQLRQPGGNRPGRAAAGPGVRRGPAPSGGNHRAAAFPGFVHRWPAGPGPYYPSQRGAAPFQLSFVAGGLCRAAFYGCLLA